MVENESLKMLINENSLLLLGNNWNGMGWETHAGHWDGNWGKNLDVGHWYWYWEKRHWATTGRPANIPVPKTNAKSQCSIEN